MTAGQQQLIDRLRTLLADRGPVRGVAMFGGRSFMVNDKLIVAARQRGDLLVRAAAGRHDELLTRPGAGQATMGSGRSMGRGWIAVAPSAIAADAELSAWLEIALEHNRAVTTDPG